MSGFVKGSSSKGDFFFSSFCSLPCECVNQIVKNANFTIQRTCACGSVLLENLVLCVITPKVFHGESLSRLVKTIIFAAKLSYMSFTNQMLRLLNVDIELLRSTLVCTQLEGGYILFYSVPVRSGTTNLYLVTSLTGRLSYCFFTQQTLFVQSHKVYVFQFSSMQ